jgi:hypothetical protein
MAAEPATRARHEPRKAIMQEPRRTRDEPPSRDRQQQRDPATMTQHAAEPGQLTGRDHTFDERLCDVDAEQAAAWTVRSRRAAVVMALGAVAVHELRFLLAYDGDGSRLVNHDGHPYGICEEQRMVRTGRECQ